jgi:hypothetical protein
MRKNKKAGGTLQKKPFYRKPIPPIIAVIVCVCFSVWFIYYYSVYLSDYVDTVYITMTHPQEVQPIPVRPTPGMYADVKTTPYPTGIPFVITEYPNILVVTRQE